MSNSTTTKVRLESEEWYPVHSIENSGIECEVPTETVERWKRVETEFGLVQKEMEDAIAAAIKREREKQNAT